MHFLHLFITLLALPFVSSAPTPIRNDATMHVVPRDCAVLPSTPDPAVLAQVWQVVQSRGLSDARGPLAVFETAWVESHVNNLDCGDQDSYGVFQQRPSQGWGDAEQIQDVSYAANQFIDALVLAAQQYPGYTAGQLAQAVQRSEFPDRYDQAVDQATVRNLFFTEHWRPNLTYHPYSQALMAQVQGS